MRNIAAWGMLFFSGMALAADGADFEHAYLMELPVVLTASRLTQPLDDSPSAMTVIDRQMIRASGFRKLPELFRLVPGMYVGSNNGYSSFVSYHGTTDNFARRMQVMVDGRSVYLPPFSSVTWDNLPVLLEDIERIEVIRGPSAASHGANSTQGVINIITRDAGMPGADQVSITQGSNGISDISALLGQTSQNLDQRFSVGYRADNGYDWPSFNDDNRTRMFNWRGNYHPNGVDNLDIKVGYSEATRGEGIVARNESPFRNTLASYDFQQAVWTRALDGGDELRINYQHTHSSYDDDQSSVLQDGVTPFPKLNIQTQRHDVELQHTIQWLPDNRLVWGAGMRSDAVTAPLGFLVPAPTLIQSRVFAHDEWRIRKDLLVNAGAMWEDDGMGHHEVSPRLSVNYHLTPSQTLRIGTSVAYRSPSTLEEYGNTQAVATRQILSHGGLRPEKMNSREIGYIGNFSKLGVIIDARLYEDRVTDLVYIDPICVDPTTCAAAYNSFKNLYQVDFRGWESTLKYQWDVYSSVILNYAHQQASCSAVGTRTSMTDPDVPAWAKSYLTDEFQNLLSQCSKMVPTNSGSILFDHRISAGLALSAGYYFQDEVQVLDAGTAQTPMQRVDIKITRSIGKRDESGGGEVSLVVQNLFRDRHTEYSSIPQQGNPVLDRRAYLIATFIY